MSYVLRIMALVLSALSVLTIVVKDIKVGDVMLLVSVAVLCLAVDSVVRFRGGKKK